MATHSAELDRALLIRIRGLPHRPALDRLLRLGSQATDHGHGWLALTTAGALLDRSRRRTWLRGLATLWASEHISREVKQRVARRRPQLADLPPLAPTPDPLSFPSSHTVNAVVAALVLSPVLPAPGLWTFAAILAASRPYLGVHYPADVAAGGGLGWCVGQLVRTMTARA